jgi:hypothetical protein
MEWIWKVAVASTDSEMYELANAEIRREMAIFAIDARVRMGD